MKQARNTKGFVLPSFCKVMPGAVAQGAIRGILLAVSTGSSAATQPLVAGPMTAIALFWVTSLVAALPDSEGSDLLSAVTTLIFLPSIPPALFASYTASSKPDSMLLP